MQQVLQVVVVVVVAAAAPDPQYVLIQRPGKSPAFFVLTPINAGLVRNCDTDRDPSREAAHFHE